MKINLNKNKIIRDINKTFSHWGFSKKGLLRNSKGEWYLFSQLLIIILHLLPRYPNIGYVTFPTNILFTFVGIIVSIKGFIIALKAFIDLGNNLTPLPYPIKESILVKVNSYKHARHPLYKGLLYISLGICILSLSLLHLSLFIALFYILKIKAIREEKLLKIKFPEYEDYIREVPAIIKNINLLDWRS